MENSMSLIQTYLVPWSLKILLALAILLVGRLIASRVTRLAVHVMEKSGMDAMLVKFLSSVAYVLLLIVVMVAAIDALGVNVTSLLAIVGAAGLAVGLALKDSLSNLAAGVMIIVFRPFRIGDLITAAGHTGSVDEIGMFNTMLRTIDNQRIIMPNSSVINSTIVNASVLPTRRIDLIISISYEDDIGKARDIISTVVKTDTRVLQEPSFTIGVIALADSSVDLFVRPWVATDQYWDVRAALMENIKKALEAAGLTIPYPQQNVYMHQVNKE